MTTLAPYYRLYDLPWSPTEEVEQRFRKVMRNAFIVFVIRNFSCSSELSFATGEDMFKATAILDSLFLQY